MALFDDTLAVFSICSKEAIIKNILFFLSVCLAISFPCYALQPVVTLTGGLTTLLGQQSQTLYFANTVFQYQPDSSSSFKSMMGGFIGAEYPFNQKWRWQFGLGYYQANSSSINGRETQAPILSVDAINLWNYHYKIVSRQLLFENKLFFNFQTTYHPYVLIGIGEGFNYAYAFQVSSQNSGEVATVIFEDRTNRSLICSLGLGIDIDMLKHMRIGVGYRVTYLGKYDLGKGTLNTGTGGNIFYLPALTSTRPFNHTILIQLTYLV